MAAGCIEHCYILTVSLRNTLLELISVCTDDVRSVNALAH